jgi:hypothetical protein
LPQSIVDHIIAQRKPSGDLSELSSSLPQEGGDEPQEDDSGLLTCANELIEAVHSKDPQAVVSALQSAFELMEQEPHEEAPHDMGLGEEGQA